MEETLQGLQIGIDNMWLLIAGFLVMFMQPGFAMVEAGFTRSKNTANILMKNLMDFSIGSIIILDYWIYFNVWRFNWRNYWNTRPVFYE